MLFRSDRKSTRLNSSHTIISYAVFCLKKKKNKTITSSLVQARRACGLGHPRGTACSAARRPQVGPLNLLRRVLHGRILFFFFLMIGHPPKSPLFPYTPLFR